MAVYDRNKGKPGKTPNLWISYAVTEELRSTIRPHEAHATRGRARE